MSEVRRYYVGKYGLVEGESLGRLSVVLAAEFDRVTAERDAVRETLENSYTAEDHERLVAKGQELNVKYIEKLEQRLTAADERADQAVTIIGKWKAIFGESMARRSELYVMTDAFLATLKPADGTSRMPKAWTLSDIVLD